LTGIYHGLQIFKQTQKEKNFRTRNRHPVFQWPLILKSSGCFVTEGFDNHKVNMVKYINLENADNTGGDIWLALSEIEERDDLSFLTKIEQEYYRNFEHERRKREFVESRAILKDMAKRAGLHVSSLKLKKTSEGRPYGVTKKEEFFVSIAHTNRFVFCGLSINRPIGVDLEPFDREIHPGVRSRILSDEELENKSLQKVDTVRLWTIKEAIVKLTGGGLGKHLSISHVTKTDTYVFKAAINEYKIQIYSRKYLDHWLSVAVSNP